MTVTADAWDAFHRRWSRLKPPLRASPEVVEAIDHAITGRDEAVLLLGVTPELAALGKRMIAVDWSETMIAHIWPGNSTARRAILGDWRSMPQDGARFSAVIGDGSLNTLATADIPVVLGELQRVLSPGGRVAIRVYATPSPCERTEELRATVMAGEASGFHAFKWRLAMALAGEAGCAEVPVARIHERFTALFPDRQELSCASGWSLEDIGEIDAYAGSRTVYSFPTEAELLGALPKEFKNPRFIASGTYELAERCPVFVADFTP